MAPALAAGVSGLVDKGLLDVRCTPGCGVLGAPRSGRDGRGAASWVQVPGRGPEPPAEAALRAAQLPPGVMVCVSEKLAVHSSR